MKKTEQEEFWEGDFGNEYTARNAGDWDSFYRQQWGITRTELNREFLVDVDLKSRILEVGCNRANQLKVLKSQGYENLWGLEINKHAISIAREDKEFNIVEGSGFDIPFKDSFFDLVFTSGVLIHIAPENLPRMIDEIHRVSNRFIWGFEYFAEDCTEIQYRGHQNRLWKNNFMKLYLDRFSDLSIVKSRMVKYVANENADMMFLLEKK
ncbi:MAG: pseudaminic acid biosynthesis-associated methylase [Candidatus Thorarchaeota archaeon]